MREDAELLNAFVTKRDQNSFRELVARRIGFVYAVNRRRLRDPHLAQDATQAVFIALARKAASVARCPSVMGWLHRCACYESLNLMRAQSNRILRETEAERLGTTTGGAITPGDAGALDAVLDEILNELPGDDRDAIIARYFFQQSYAEIGTKTGRSENATRMRVERALAKLRDRLESRGFVSATAALVGLLPTYATAAVPSGLAVTVANTALTTVGAGAVSAAVILSMSTTKIIAAAAVFAAVGFVGYHAYQNHNLKGGSADPHEQNTQRNDGNRALEKATSAVVTKKIAGLASSAATHGRKNMPFQAASAGDPAATGITRSAPAGWFKNGNNLKAFEVGVDPTQAFGGVSSAYVKSVDDSAAKGFGGMGQSTSADQYQNQRVRLTGWIKTEDANDGGGHLWLRVDGATPGQSVAFDNMANRAPTGTTDWQEYSVVLDVPNEATSLNYGFFLKGQGQMWVNGVNIERVGTDVPSTNILKPQAPPKPLPTAPVNLDFNPTPATGG
ncbi:MAG: RNA polymerase sigma factor [Lacunisphaera sp.]